MKKKQNLSSTAKVDVWDYLEETHYAKHLIAIYDYLKVEPIEKNNKIILKKLGKIKSLVKRP